MPITIDIPEAAWAEQKVPLGGFLYTIVHTYNTRDSRRRIDILLEGDVVISGIKIIESQSLLNRYRLDDFSHGDIVCLKIYSTEEEVGLLNLGAGKPYELIYMTNEEILDL